MIFDDSRTQLSVAWAMLVSLAALAIGITSISDWVAASCLALVPPLVARSLRHRPDQAIAESVRHDCR